MYRTLTFRFFRCVAVVSLLWATSCSNGEISECTDSSDHETLPIELGVRVHDVSTRTHLDPDGAGTGTVIPVYWSDGDRINVNGSNSDPLRVGNDEKRIDAEFTVRNVTAPFYILYPAGIYMNAADESGRLVTVELPAEQHYSPTSFGEGTAILYGSAEMETGPIFLNNRCGAIRLSLTDDAVDAGVLRKIVLSSNGSDAPIAGTFQFNLEDGTLVSTGGTNEVTLLLPEDGISLSNTEAKDFYFTIPAGEYPEGFTITILGDLGRTMTCQWLRSEAGADPGVVVTAGRIVNFAQMNFDASRQITSVEDWEAFAASVNGGDAWEEEWACTDGVVRLATDIATEKALTHIKNWTGVFDGCGHTITQAAATLPLFGRVTGGTIRNLVLAGEMNPAEPTGATTGAVALAGLLETGGTLENCINRMSISWSGAGSIAMAGFVRSFTGGTIRKCVNEADLDFTVDCTRTAWNGYAGGIVARILTLSTSAVIEECENKGVISCTTVDTNVGLNYAYLGGIAGWLSDGTVENHAVFRNCSNHATLSFTSGSTTSASKKPVCCGGILGLGAVSSSSLISDPLTETHYYAEFDGCVNRGTIMNGGISSSDSSNPLTKVYSGGIAGVIFGLAEQHTSMTDCRNYGDIRSYEGSYSRAALCGIAGGLIGLGGYVDLVGCEVSDVTIGTLEKQSYAIGGVAGTLLTTFSVTDCRVFAQLEMIQSTNYTVNHYALGVATDNDIYGDERLSLSGSVIRNSSFGGSITTSTVLYSATNMGSPKKTEFDELNFETYIVARAYTGSDIAVEGNAYWNGL